MQGDKSQFFLHMQLALQINQASRPGCALCNLSYYICYLFLHITLSLAFQINQASKPGCGVQRCDSEYAYTEYAYTSMPV